MTFPVSHDAPPNGEEVISLIGSLGFVSDCVGKTILDSTMRIALVFSPVPEGRAEAMWNGIHVWEALPHQAQHRHVADGLTGSLALKDKMT